LNGLTYRTTVAADRAKSRASWNTRDLVLSLAILVVIVVIFAYFSPLGIAG
jgi:SSS family solute:Na+ symporter